MTAEIGILNRMGVALAADSAVTIGTSQTQKIYNSANKVFSLSKYHPVGIMVYGSAKFMGVPWETIIKSYRSKLGDIRLPYLTEYCNDFFDYLASDDRLVTAASEKESVQRVFHDYFNELLNRIDRTINKAFENQPSEEQVALVFRQKVNETLEKCERLEFLDGFDEYWMELFKEKHTDSILTIIDSKVYFELDQDVRESIVEIAAHIFSKNTFSGGYSGIVIAGYGEDEIFPSLYEFKVEGMYCKKLKMVNGENTVIAAAQEEDRTTASIRAFAQREMVDSFISGIDPELDSAINQCLHAIFEQFPELLESKLNANMPGEIKEVINETGEQLLKVFNEEIAKIQRLRYIDPIIDTVDLLPKEELAAMAESLVNLTSFKRKVTFDAETVGGPIDVAVISKGDGFIWIKRKHYFKPELNYSFIQNYLRGDNNDGSNS